MPNLWGAEFEDVPVQADVDAIPVRGQYGFHGKAPGICNMVVWLGAQVISSA